MRINHPFWDICRFLPPFAQGIRGSMLDIAVKRYMLKPDHRIGVLTDAASSVAPNFIARDSVAGTFRHEVGRRANQRNDNVLSGVFRLQGVLEPKSVRKLGSTATPSSGLYNSLYRDGRIHPIPISPHGRPPTTDRRWSVTAPISPNAHFSPGLESTAVGNWSRFTNQEMGDRSNSGQPLSATFAFAKRLCGWLGMPAKGAGPRG